MEYSKQRLHHLTRNHGHRSAPTADTRSLRSKQRHVPIVNPDGRPAGDDLIERIEELYTTDFARFVRVAAAITGNLESARDIVQDAFASLIVHRAQHREEGSIGGWAWRTVVNGAYSERRARAYEGRAVARLESLREPEGGTQVPDAALREAIRALPERQRTIVFLRYYADLDYDAIAEALAVSAGTVGAALNAARSALRAAVSDAPPAADVAPFAP